MDRKQLIKSIEDYAAASGLGIKTVCQYAAENRHLYDRLKKRVEKDDEIADRVLTWMRQNPPKQTVSPPIICGDAA